MPTSSQTSRVLIIEDDQYNGPFTHRLLQSAGFHADLAISAEQGLELLERGVDEGPDMVLLDLNLPGMSGLELVEKLKDHPEHQYIPVMLFTVQDSLECKIEGLNRGADDYLIKPYEPDELIARVNSMLRIRRLYTSLRNERQINRRLSRTMDRGERLSNLLGRSERMRRISELILDVADTDSHVLIQGESGTGKEVIAKAIHNESRRSQGPLVVVNCAAYAETLLHSELFGHEKGAFTGAIRRKPGRFEQADGGTIFLDEIGEISLPTQVILLRVIQERTFERVGSSTSRAVDVRVIVTTNRDLPAEVARDSFRQDLYFRLNVLPVAMPPLREHAEDIEELARHFLKQVADREGRPVKELEVEALNLMRCYQWPGNVRELQNICERAAVLTRDEMNRLLDQLSGLIS